MPRARGVPNEVDQHMHALVVDEACCLVRVRVGVRVRVRVRVRLRLRLRLRVRVGDRLRVSSISPSAWG